MTIYHGIHGVWSLYLRLPRADKTELGSSGSFAFLETHLTRGDMLATEKYLRPIQGCLILHLIPHEDLSYEIQALFAQPI